MYFLRLEHRFLSKLIFALEIFYIHMNVPKRWILLQHVGSPDDPKGMHFDLLLEDKDWCRSWRLESIPVLDGPSLSVSPVPVHRLEWLDHLDGQVSRARGWATRVMAGFFVGELPKNHLDPVQIELHSNGLLGALEINNFMCTLCSVPSSSFY